MRALAILLRVLLRPSRYLFIFLLYLRSTIFCSLSKTPYYTVCVVLLCLLLRLVIDPLIAGTNYKSGTSGEWRSNTRSQSVMLTFFQLK